MWIANADLGLLKIQTEANHSGIMVANHIAESHPGRDDPLEPCVDIIVGGKQRRAILLGDVDQVADDDEASNLAFAAHLGNPVQEVHEGLTLGQMIIGKIVFPLVEVNVRDHNHALAGHVYHPRSVICGQSETV